MAVVCPVCGMTSADQEFCDHCNADLGLHAEGLAGALCPIPGQAVELSLAERRCLVRPEAWIEVDGEEQVWRVHWIARAGLSQWLPRLREREAIALPCLAPVLITEESAGAWVVAEAGEAPYSPWFEPPRDDPLAELERLLDAMKPLGDVLGALHENGLVWPNFDPTALEIMFSGSLRITNLDLATFRSGNAPEGFPIQTAFAAPEVTRFLGQGITQATDVFHFALFAYYWLARLLPDGFAGCGLESFDHEIPPLRIFRPDLPLGIAAILDRGLALDPAVRWESPATMFAALRKAADEFAERRAFNGSLRWDIGWHTRTGRTKTALGRGNEDAVVVRSYPSPDRALLVVADGISTCDVGSGALASLITTIVLENSFPLEDPSVFGACLNDVCCRAAQTLVEWAIEKGYSDQLLEGRDLMGTTLSAGWLEGRSLHLANMGDSRVYLLHKSGFEQLTVDGDLGSGLLAGGTPPEDVRELGPVAKALRECVGGCTISAEREIRILEESCHPALSCWPLLRGDIVIICSDGLVEEGAFLDPRELADLLHANASLPPDELAMLLADAADALQRLPSPAEPEGFGDNISCIVARIEAS